MTKKIAIFYHLAQIGEWQNTYKEQMDLLGTSGLIDNAEFIHIGINGNDPLPFILSKARIQYNQDHVLEANTLEAVYDFCKENPNYQVLYFHGKGVSVPWDSPVKQNVEYWRKYLEYFNIEQWTVCLDYLEKYDCVGAELRDMSYHGEIKVPGLYYDGNFWWANSNYVARLDKNFLYDSSNGLTRWQSEKWIGTGGPEALSLCNSNFVNLYYEPCFPEYYRKAEPQVAPVVTQPVIETPTIGNKKSKIVMTTMFKNEAPVILRMLESCYKYIDYYVIQNNGSTDGTEKLVEEFFKDKNIPGIVYNCEEGWQGFGWNRDHLVKYTQSIDHGCDWILKMDCDEMLEVDDDFDWSVLDDHSIQSFHITAVMGNSIYYRAWMWNARLKWAFNHDPCHETIYLDDGVTNENFQRYDLPNKIRQLGFPQGQSWSNPTKFISDALLLEEKMIKENTIHSDLYHFWYIGKSYSDARHMEAFPLGRSQQEDFAKRSIYYFKEYLNVTHGNFCQTKQALGIHEMAYMALVLIGDNQKFIGELDNAIESYTLAEQFSPPRNEHLYGLAALYNENSMFDKLLEITTRMVAPDRKCPFPTYYMMIDTNVYHDTGTFSAQLHDIALRNQPKTISPFMINKLSNKKLFVVNDFYENPDEIRKFALGVEFQEDLRYYKGLRSVQSFQPPGIVEAFEKIIGQKIVHFGEGSPNGCFQITRATDPQVYHHDLQKWAAMIYLSPNAPIESGTRLIRSKINQVGHMNDPGIDVAFSGGFLDSTKFEVVDSASNVYNRLVIMDAQSIHSAGPYFGQTPEEGRLTHLFFFD